MLSDDQGPVRPLPGVAALPADCRSPAETGIAQRAHDRAADRSDATGSGEGADGMLELILCCVWSVGFAAVFGALAYWLLTDDDRGAKRVPGR